MSYEIGITLPKEETDFVKRIRVDSILDGINFVVLKYGLEKERLEIVKDEEDNIHFHFKKEKDYFKIGIRKRN